MEFIQTEDKSSAFQANQPSLMGRARICITNWPVGVYAFTSTSEAGFMRCAHEYMVHVSGSEVETTTLQRRHGIIFPMFFTIHSLHSTFICFLTFL